MGDAGRFVPFTEASDPLEAHLIAARLESEGIEARVTGESLGPYRLTVGAMATTKIWVPEGDVDAARLVLLGSEADAALSSRPPETGSRFTWVWWLVAVFLLARLLYLYVLRYL